MKNGHPPYWSVAVPALLAPTVAGAHGGISAIGALLPFLIIALGIGITLLIWLIFTFVLLLAKNKTFTVLSLRIYKTLAGMLIVASLLIGSLGMLTTASGLGLTAIFHAVAVGVVSHFAVSKANLRYASD